jgi:lysyl-tRNA synthetase class 2
VTKSIPSLFKDLLGFELTPETSREHLVSLARQHKIEMSTSDTWDDVYFRIFLEKIEPTFKNYPALIIMDYPPSMAALAKINDRGFADRMELYIAGIEIANAFNELTNATEQRKRFISQQGERAERGKVQLPIDENFMRGLEGFMPPSGGIALGLDRLFMAIYGLKTIQETRAFPMRDELKGFK